ncbi:MAG: efflux RND transporter periplasmic adaptor subunit [Spirochaetia bacterium]|nr:efflux RND transporter periplasmic adaptor subunit [Spirochaetia bacterium]
MNNIKIKKHNIILLLAVVIISLSSCTKPVTTSETTESEKVIKPLSVNAARVVVGEIDLSISVGGSVTTANPVAIIGEASGTLKDFDLEVGDTVEKDQIVAKIDPSRPGMEYKMKDVKAPISGTIVRVGVENGSLSSPSVPLAYIENLDDISIQVRIIEKYISSIKIGEDVELRFEAFPNEILHGSVTKMDPTVDTSTRTIGITIKFDDPEKKVLAGMYAKCRIITKTVDDALIIPSTAVFYNDNESYVYKIVNDTVTKTPITKGLETYNFVQVTDGLLKDDLIVNTKSSLLGEGVKIVVKNQGEF